MYLYVWLDGTSRVVTENPTAGDIMGVAFGTLRVFRWSNDKKRFFQLVKDEAKLVWVPVKEARTISSPDIVLHLA